MQSVDEFLEFIETWCFTISFSTCQCGNRYEYIRGQDYHIGTARKILVDIDATPDLLFLIQQKLHIVQYR